MKGSWTLTESRDDEPNARGGYASARIIGGSAPASRGALQLIRSEIAELQTMTLHL